MGVCRYKNGPRCHAKFEVVWVTKARFPPSVLGSFSLTMWLSHGFGGEPRKGSRMGRHAVQLSGPILAYDFGLPNAAP